MTDTLDQRVPFPPVNREGTYTELWIEGTIPAELDGLYVRNGPNPIGAMPSHQHGFSGHGMVHGVRLSGGRALWYRNRIVRTGDVPTRLGEADPGGPITHGRDASPNTNVVAFADRLYATMEAGANPVELGPNLDTIARSTLNGALCYGFTGHHKVDPIGQDVHALVYGSALGHHAQYIRLSPEGQLLHEAKVPYCPPWSGGHCPCKVTLPVFGRSK